MTDQTRRWLLPATVGLLALAACITSIGHDFTYDDRYVILLNDRVHSLRGFWRFLRIDLSHAAFSERVHGLRASASHSHQVLQRGGVRFSGQRNHPLAVQLRLGRCR